jgi:hypothetical protein
MELTSTLSIRLELQLLVIEVKASISEAKKASEVLRTECHDEGEATK